MRTKPAWMGPLPLALALLFAASNLWHPVVFFDEGYAAYAAWRIHAGELPYRDFFANYAPGSFCANAALFWLGGDKLIVLRAADLVVRLTLAVLCGLLARRAGPVGGSGAFVATLVFLCSFGGFGYAMVPAMALAFSGALAWLRALRQASRPWALAAGALAALTAFFRQDLGGYFAAALLLHALLLRFWAAERWAWRGVLWAALAAVAVGCALFLPFVAVVGWSRLWALLVTGPLSLRTGAYVLPLPAWDLPWRLISSGEAVGLGLGFVLGQLELWIALYASLIVLGVVALSAMLRLRRGNEHAPAALLMALLGALLLRQALNRAEMVHVFPMTFCALAALGAFPGRRGWALGGKALTLALMTALVLIPLAGWSQYVLQQRSWPRAQEGPAAGLPLPEDLRQAAQSVAATTPPGSRIFVANVDMGRGILNNVLVYFLAQRPCASYYILVIRPMPKAAVADILDALVQPSTSAVVLWKGLGPDHGQHPLDLALASFGRPGGTWGDYELRLAEPALKAP